MGASSGSSRLVVGKTMVLTLSLLLTVALLAPHTFGVATPTQGTWAKTYGGSGLDVFHSIQQTSDGGFIAAGETGSFGGDGTWVVKLDEAGNVGWQNVYGGGCFGSSSARETSDGGFVISGATSSFPSNNTCVTRLDASGSVVWQKAYSGAGRDAATSLEITSDGGFIVAGVTTYRGGRLPDAFALRLDADGNVLWQRTYGAQGGDGFASIEPTSDGGFIAAGVTGSFGAGSFDAWVLKLDPLGNVVWQNVYGGPGTDRVLAVGQTFDGGFITAGTTSPSPLEFDTWILRLDPFGEIVWQKTYGFGEATAVQQTSDGGFIVTDQVANGGFRKLDDRGNVVWVRIYGGSRDDDLFSIQQTSDGGFVAAGFTKSFGVVGEEGTGDAWVLRVDQRGGIIGQCHQKSRSNTPVTDTNSTTTVTQAVADDVSTVVTEPVTVLTPTVATVGAQCLPNGRRP